MVIVYSEHTPRIYEGKVVIHQFIGTWAVVLTISRTTVRIQPFGFKPTANVCEGVLAWILVWLLWMNGEGEDRLLPGLGGCSFANFPRLQQASFTSVTAVAPRPSTPSKKAVRDIRMLNKMVVHGFELTSESMYLCWFRAAKVTGSTNYRMVEVLRLLDLVRQYLPLGKDEWECLATVYNTSRGRSWAERDYESLRRKFKLLYGMRKPTGKGMLPDHVKNAKELKRAIDDKVNVIELDDEADADDPDFGVDVESDDLSDSSLKEDVDRDVLSSSNTTDYSADGAENVVGNSLNDEGAEELNDLLQFASTHEGLEVYTSRLTRYPSVLTLRTSHFY